LCVPGLGATGNYPYGRLDSDDDGERVRVDFGKPVAWPAMQPEVAERFGAALLGTGARSDPRRGRPGLSS
jgi:hypothetical protein